MRFLSTCFLCVFHLILLMFPSAWFQIFGNKVEGDARTFTSGNRGWYAGKKILVKVGDKQVWAQVGLNITIIGSKEWSDK